MKWHFTDSKGTRYGPMAEDQARRFAADGVLAKDTEVEVSSDDGWIYRGPAGNWTPRDRRSKPLSFAQVPRPRPPTFLDSALPVLSALIGRPDQEILEALILVQAGMAYDSVRIPKVRGGTREINPPKPVLKRVQRAILERLLYQIPVHFTAHGFCRNRDIMTNAMAHIRARAVVNHDLKDAFPSVQEQRVAANLRPWARRLVTTQFGHVDSAAMVTPFLDLLLRLVLHNGSLPQGAPTSPAILNIVCLNLDRSLFALCSQHGLTVTRYADDITVSSEKDQIPGAVKQQIRSVIYAAGWKINQTKSKDLERANGHSIEITGLLIHEDGRVTIAPDRRRAYRKYLLEHAKQSRVDGEVRAKAEGIIAFVRRVYQRLLPSDLRGPVEELERQLEDLPRPEGQPRRPSMNRYGPQP